MKRMQYTSFLRQRRLARKLVRRARRSKVAEWTYRDHVCSVNFDVANGQFVGTMNIGVNERLLFAQSLDELMTAFHRTVDEDMDDNKAAELVPNRSKSS